MEELEFLHTLFDTIEMFVPPTSKATTTLFMKSSFVLAGNFYRKWIFKNTKYHPFDRTFMNFKTYFISLSGSKLPFFKEYFPVCS